MIGMLKNILLRVWVFYLILIVLFFLFVDHKTTIRSAQLQTLSRLTPSFNYLKMMNADKPQEKDLAACVQYHRYVVDFVSSAAPEGWAMAGYCSMRMGRIKDAHEAFERSISLNPNYFWNYYHQGMLFLSQGEFARAGENFSKALQQDPRATIFVLTRSKVFMDVQHSSKEKYNIEESLLASYRQVAELIKVCQVCLQGANAPFCRQPAAVKAVKIF
jgi:tetratricopeptide (TPR) repeat protein